MQDIIQPILLPLNIKVIEDCSEMAEPHYLNFDSHFEVCYLSNQTHSWTMLQTMLGGNHLSFEFEEYLADQLNRQYDWVTVADNYRLMADHLRGNVLSGYYSILFEQDHSIFLVDNSIFYDDNCLYFKKLYCIAPTEQQKIVDQNYKFETCLNEQYIGHVSEDAVFYPIMKSTYVPLVLSELIERACIE